MLTLKAEKRNPDEKAKKLRRDGFITGVLYGKEMKENVSLKFTEKDASAFIKNAKEGTQAYLELDGKNVDVLVKNIDFDPLTKKYMALDFQALVAGEIVSATVPHCLCERRQGTGYLRSRIVRGALQSRSRTSAGAR